MTDLEITRWLAEKVMQWAIVNGSIHTEGETAWTGRRLSDFEPLTDPGATAEVMEALRAKGYEVLIHFYFYPGSEILARVIGPDSVGSEQRTKTETWTRALCLAACRATGAEV